MSLKKKIAEKTAKIGVIGLGYVGLPLAVEKAKVGYTVLGFDIMPSRVDMVNRGENYIGDVIQADLEKVVQDFALTATGDFTRLEECDIISICVPTPLDSYKQPDLSCVTESAKQIRNHMKPDTLVILESTTYPTTTESVLLPILEAHGKKCGTDFYLAFSPERVDPGNKLYNTKNTPKVVGGVDNTSTELAKMLYETVLSANVKTVSTTKEAEFSKILENTFRIVNISLINELAILADKMGVNIWEVIDAAATKPFGFMPFYPGIGVGGHCIPIDPFYLTFIAQKYNLTTSMIRAAGEINDKMPAYTVERISRILNNQKIALKESSILMVGIAYKGDISDVRESPALKVYQQLNEMGAYVDVVDPYVESFEYNGQMIKTIKLTPFSLKSVDIVVIATAHKENVNYSLIYEKAKMIFDTKNIFSNLGFSKKSNIYVL